MNTFRAFICLMRPANIMTALADIVAGFSVSLSCMTLSQGSITYPSIPLLWLLLATTGLYGGGIVFNDVFDAKRDRQERPERLIPRGILSQRQATLFGVGLFFLGIGAAYQASLLSFGTAITICILTFLYNLFAKHHPLLGPITMGLCRSGNLLLGASALGWFSCPALWTLGVSHLVFITAITLISRGEVDSSPKPSLWPSAILYLMTIILTLFAIMKDGLNILLPFLMMLVFAYCIFKPLIKAIKTPLPLLIRHAVKAGIISLILLDAAITSGFAPWLYGLYVLGLMPLSLLLARYYAVT